MAHKGSSTVVTRWVGGAVAQDGMSPEALLNSELSKMDSKSVPTLGSLSDFKRLEAWWLKGGWERERGGRGQVALGSNPISMAHLFSKPVHECGSL